MALGEYDIKIHKTIIPLKLEENYIFVSGTISLM